MAKVRIFHFILVAMTGIWFVGGNAIASESTNWLMNNPVSMMDWGSAKAKESAQNTVDQLNHLMERREKQDYDLEDKDFFPEEVKKKILEDRKKATSSWSPQTVWLSIRSCFCRLRYAP